MSIGNTLLIRIEVSRSILAKISEGTYGGAAAPIPPGTPHPL